MKAQFVFNGKKYISETKKQAQDFLKYWDSPFSKVFELKIGWNINGIERAPGWVLVPVIEDDKIEYEKRIK